MRTGEMQSDCSRAHRCVQFELSFEIIMGVASDYIARREVSGLIDAEGENGLRRTLRTPMIRVRIIGIDDRFTRTWQSQEQLTFTLRHTIQAAKAFQMRCASVSHNANLRFG